MAPSADGMQAFAAMLGAAKPCEDGCSHVPDKGEQADFAIVAYPAFVATSAE